MTPEVNQATISRLFSGNNRALFPALPITRRSIPHLDFTPISTDTAFDHLLKILHAKGIVDDKGRLPIDFTGKPLPPLGASQLDRLNALLFSQMKIKSSRNGFKDISISLMEFLQFFASSDLVPKIQKVEIVGGAVMWILGPEYLQQILIELGLSLEEYSLNLSEFNELFTQPPDIDIRIFLENNASSQNLKQISYLISQYLANKLTRNVDFSSIDLIDAEAYTKRKLVDNGINHFLAIGFGNRADFNIDLLFISKQLHREELFIHDSLFINITGIVAPPLNQEMVVQDDKAICPWGNFNSGWSSLLFRGMKILHAKEAHHIDLPGSMMLFSNYIKGWKCPAPDLELQLLKTILTFYHMPEGQGKVFEMLNKILANHFPNKPLAPIAYCFALCDVLHRHGHYQLSPLMVEHLLTEMKTDDKALSLSWKTLHSLLKEKKVPFEVVSSSCALMAYLHYFQKKADPANFEQDIRLSTNGGHPVFLWKNSSSALYLPLSTDLENVIDIVKKSIADGNSHHLEYLKERIFPDIDIKSYRISEIAFEDEFGIVMHAANNALNMLEGDFPILHSVGFTLLCYCGLLKDDSIYIAYLVKRLPQILAHESSGIVRQRLFRHFINYCRSTKYDLLLSCKSNDLKIMEERLGDSVIGHNDILDAFCRAFSGISHVKTFYAVNNSWLLLLANSSKHSVINLGKFLIEQYQKENPGWALRMLDSLIKNKNYTYDELIPLFNSLCSCYQKPSSHQALALDLLQLEKSAEHLIAKIPKHKTSRHLTYDSSFYLWLANLLSANHPEISQQLLIQAASKNLMSKHKEDFAQSWLIICKSVLSFGSTENAYKTWQKALRTVQESIIHQSEGWIQFHIEFLTLLFNNGSLTPNYINEILHHLSTSSLNENQNTALRNLIVEYLQQKLIDSIPSGFPIEFIKKLESPIGKFLKKMDHINFLIESIKLFSARVVVDHWVDVENWINTIKESGLSVDDDVLLREVLIELYEKISTTDNVEIVMTLLKRMTSSHHPWGKLFTKQGDLKAKLALSWHEIMLLKNPQIIERSTEILLSCFSDNISKENATKIALHVAQQKLLSKSQVSLLRPKLGLLISTLESYPQESETPPLALCHLFKILHAAEVDIYAIPNMNQHFWKILREFLKEQPLSPETFSLVSSLAAIPKARESKEPNKEDTLLYFRLAEICIANKSPLECFNWLEKGFISLHDQNLAADHPFVNTSYHCCELLCFGKKHDKALHLLNRIQKRTGGEHFVSLSRRFYQLAIDLENIDLGMSADIMVQKQELMLLIPQELDTMSFVEKIIEKLSSDPNETGKLSIILELANLYKLNKANLWKDIFRLVYAANDKKKTDTAFTIFWSLYHYNFSAVKESNPEINLAYRPLIGTKTHVAACWVFLLDIMSDFQSRCFEQLIDHYREILLLFEEPEMLSHMRLMKESFLFGFLALLNLPKNEEEKRLLHNRILPVLEEIEFGLQDQFSIQESLSIHLAFVHGFIDTKNSEIYFRVCARFLILLQVPQQILDGPLIKIANQIAYQFQFVNDEALDCKVLLLQIFRILHKSKPDARCYMQFLEAFSKHPSSLLFEEAYNLVLSFILQCSEKSKKIESDILLKALSSIRRIMARLLQANDHKSRVLYLQLLHLSNANNLFSAPDLSGLWGDFILNHYPNDKLDDKVSLLLFLDIFMDYQVHTLANREIRGQCYKKVADTLVLLSVRHQDHDSFNKHLISIGSLLGSESVSNLIVEIRSKTKSSLEASIKIKEISADKDITTELTKNFISNGDLGIQSLFKESQKKKVEKNVLESERIHKEMYFNFIVDLTHKLIEEKTDDLDSQIFIHSFGWAIIPTLAQVYPKKSEEIAHLFHHFVFKYFPCHGVLFKTHMSVVSHLFYSLQTTNILDAFPEITFEVVLYVDLKLCVKPHISTAKKRKCFTHVIELLCRNNTPFFTWRSILLLDKFQHEFFNNYPSQLDHCYEPLFTSVKLTPFFAVGDSTIIDDLFKILVLHAGLHDLPMSHERSLKIGELLSKFFDLVFEIASKHPSPPPSSKIGSYYSYLMSAWEVIKLLHCMRSQPDKLLRMLERMMPRGAIHFGLSGQDDIFECLLFCHKQYGKDAAAMKIIANSLNKWIKLLNSVFGEEGKTHVRDILEYAITHNLYLHSPEALKEIMGSQFPS